MRILYVNHTSAVSGAERSLLELLAGLPLDVDAVVACPRGQLAHEVSRLALPVVSLPGSNVSFRIHPWHTLRGVSQIGMAAAKLRRLAEMFNVQLVHANSIRSGLVAGLATSLGAPPAVVHVRDCMPQGRTAELVRRFLSARVAGVFANSRYTADNYAAGVAVRRARVVYNAVDLGRFDPGRIDRDAARRELGLEPAAHVLGVVSQITPWKAQDDAIRILAALREQGFDARLLVVGSAKFTVGSTRYDNEAFERSLHALARDLGVEGAVRFLGERTDVPTILRALDLVLVPSWEEPFGRIVIEAMAMETPVLATAVGGPAEVIGNGDGGVLLPPRDPRGWAAEAASLLRDGERRRELGRRGRRVVAARFTRDAHVAAVVEGYEEVLDGAPAGPPNPATADQRRGRGRT